MSVETGKLIGDERVKMAPHFESELSALQVLAASFGKEVVLEFKKNIDDEQFSEGQLALGRKITEYYSRDDLPFPDDDETKRPSPFLNLHFDSSKV